MGAQPGFLRLKSIIAPHGPIPVSKSTWWSGVAAGRYPKPVRLGPRITAWRSEDIATLIREFNGETERLSPVSKPTSANVQFPTKCNEPQE
jgi:prophage regulatory protein